MHGRSSARFSYQAAHRPVQTDRLSLQILTAEANCCVETVGFGRPPRTERHGTSTASRRHVAAFPGGFYILPAKERGTSIATPTHDLRPKLLYCDCIPRANKRTRAYVCVCARVCMLVTSVRVCAADGSSYQRPFQNEKCLEHAAQPPRVLPAASASLCSAMMPAAMDFTLVQTQSRSGASDCVFSARTGNGRIHAVLQVIACSVWLRNHHESADHHRIQVPSVTVPTPTPSSRNPRGNLIDFARATLAHAANTTDTGD